MRSIFIFGLLCIVLVSCDDTSESNEDIIASNGPSSIKSGVWVIEKFSLGNNTCGPAGVSQAAYFSYEPRTMMLMEKQGVLSVAFGREAVQCERSGNEFSCDFPIDSGAKKGHYGPRGGPSVGGQIWEADLEWSCSSCNGRELADAATINGVLSASRKGCVTTKPTRQLKSLWRKTAKRRCGRASAMHRWTVRIQ